MTFYEGYDFIVKPTTLPIETIIDALSVIGPVFDRGLMESGPLEGQVHLLYVGDRTLPQKGRKSVMLALWADGLGWPTTQAELAAIVAEGQIRFYGSIETQKKFDAKRAASDASRRAAS